MGSCPRAWLPAPSPARCQAPFVGMLWLPPPTAPAGICQGWTAAPAEPGFLRRRKANAAQGRCPTASDHPCPGWAGAAAKIQHVAKQSRAQEVKP